MPENTLPISSSPYITMGFLGGSMVIEQLFQAGIIDASKSAGVNLFIFSGGVLENPNRYDAQRSKIFELAGKENVNGLIIGSDLLGHFVGAEKIKEFCERYKPLPIVKNEPLIEGYPTLLFDFYQGMYDAVSHLIETHHYTRIGYIGGPEQSKSIKDRFRAYQDVLKKHSIPLDPKLIVEGSIYAPSGDEAIRVFLDERKLKPVTDLQAIVAFNDFIAVDALNSLQARGINVPDEIAIVGMDDDEFAFATNPRLTTVRLPFYELGRLSMDTLVAVLTGKKPAQVTTIPAHLVIRQSCGCPAHQTLHLLPEDNAPIEHIFQPEFFLHQNQEAILLKMIEAVGFQNFPRFRQDVEDLLSIFINEIEQHLHNQQTTSFPQRLESILSRIIHTHYSIEVFYDILAIFQNEIFKILRNEAFRAWFKDLTQQAYLIAGDYNHQFLINEINRATYLDTVLHEINQEMATSLEVADLTEVLMRNIPRLGVPACYLALYENPENLAGNARLILAYNRQRRVQIGPEGIIFPAKQLIPPEVRSPVQPEAHVILPIFHQEEQLGFVVFEIGPLNGSLYEALREQISSALKRIELHQNVVKARQQAEEANQLKSKFLSIVTHELRTPLSMIVSLSEMLLERSTENRDRLPVSNLRELEAIYATSQHLDRLVSDVLDLGRSQLGQLKLEMRSVQLDEFLKEIQLVGEQMANDKQLSWRADIPSILPPVKADRTRLRQIFLNLISNACKFTLQGSVHLNVQSTDDEVIFTISDTGLGIPIKDQGTIFDEFHQSERTAARGYGGMGLGLAITRRLVELHGGHIHMVSSGQEGAGTQFTFTLPVLTESTPAYLEVEGVQSDEPLVLIISGEKSSNDFLADHLEQRGFRVVCTEMNSEYHGLEELLALPCGAIVLNCEPATEWGLNLMRHLKSHPEAKDIPILFYRILPNRESGTFLNIDYLSKPINPKTLVQMIEERGWACSTPTKTPRTILIVDDEGATLRLHAQLIREHLPYCQVLEAQSGIRALEIMKQTVPDLVLLDLMMPELDGFGVLESMQTYETLRTIPVIIMTGQILTEEMIQRINRSVVAILQKGVFTVEETLQKIEDALSRHRRLGSETQRIVRRAMAFIHRNYSEPITRETIANYLGVNERYLTQIFKKEVGITPIRYLNRYRIKMAKQFLETRNKMITEIGLEVGFSSVAHFNRVFREETGMSPRAYLHNKI